MTVSAQDFRDRYAVGGEILPVSAATFLFNPWVLAIIMALVLLAGGAIYTGTITIDIVE
ncbi:hypothetical protein GF319_05685 [Candidatus Bathyarchaeota archaeon]|nr:hypothetical protein [Candidatus Bathyarchaeota archaeon]